MKSAPKVFPMILHAILALIGLALVFLADRSFRQTRKLLREGVHATATVIAMIENDDGEDLTYTPRFQFLDRNQSPVEFTGKVGSSNPIWKVGDKAPMIYDPTTSQHRILSYWSLFRAEILLLAFAAPFLVIGIGYFVFHVWAADWMPLE